jgi:hypothetical protein
MGWMMKDDDEERRRNLIIDWLLVLWLVLSTFWRMISGE